MCYFRTAQRQKCIFWCFLFSCLWYNFLTFSGEAIQPGLVWSNTADLAEVDKSFTQISSADQHHLFFRGFGGGCILSRPYKVSPGLLQTWIAAVRSAKQWCTQISQIWLLDRQSKQKVVVESRVLPLPGKEGETLAQYCSMQIGAVVARREQWWLIGSSGGSSGAVVAHGK